MFWNLVLAVLTGLFGGYGVGFVSIRSYRALVQRMNGRNIGPAVGIIIWLAFATIVAQPLVWLEDVISAVYGVPWYVTFILVDSWTERYRIRLSPPQQHAPVPG